MAQQVKALVPKHDDLSSVSGTPKGGRREPIPRSKLSSDHMYDMCHGTCS